VNQMLSFLSAHRRAVLVWAMLTVMFVLSVAPSFAQSIEFDSGMLITQANQWIDTFLPILAIPFGIGIAIALIVTVGGLIVKSIRSLGGGGGM
jgi:hypothetical protein